MEIQIFMKFLPFISAFQLIYQYVNNYDHQQIQFNKSRQKMDSQILQPSAKQYEDIQVDSIGCCSTFIHKADSKENIQRYDSQKILRHSRQKGISVISRSATKFNQYLHTPLKLNIKSTNQQKKYIGSPIKDEELKNVNDSKLQRTNATSKKFLRVQRCIDYKNKKILQHNNKTYQQDINRSKKQNDNELLQSTRKNTFRTTNQSVLKISIIKNTESIIQQSSNGFIKCQNNDQSPYKKLQIPQNRTNNKKSQKTLSKLYQKSKGVKFQTIVSVQSENGDLQSGKQSIILPFSFANNLTA